MSEEWIGLNLKQVRSQAGLSLTKAAELTGVSKAMLGQIERGESSPTLTTLWKICKGLHIPFTALIGIPSTSPMSSPPEEGLHHHLKEGPPFLTLFPFDPKTGCEVFVHELPPHWEHLSNAHSKGVIEDIFVIEGAVEILVGADWVSVDCGQAMRFKADQPHGYRNPFNKLSRFHNTIHYPAHIEAE